MRNVTFRYCVKYHLSAENHNRVFVSNNPVNWVDPYGLVWTPSQDGSDWNDAVPSSFNIPTDAGVSLCFNNFEWSEENGCHYICWSLTTDLVGGGIQANLYSPTEGSPVSFQYGLGKYGGANIDVGGVYDDGKWNMPNGGASLGLSLGLPVGGSARMVCWKTTETGDDGCPCQESPNKSFFGTH